MACGALQHPAEKNNLTACLEDGSSSAFNASGRRFFKEPAFFSERLKPCNFLPP
jgi:hypothetical protein